MEIEVLVLNLCRVGFVWLVRKCEGDTSSSRLVCVKI